tara:strand:- start:409 stop:666 length:258 start_codon:yes stop_codon:yes gene_type:complete
MAAQSTSDYYKENPIAAAKRRKQQAKYNKTDKGKKLIANAQKLRAKLKIPKGSKMDAAHWPNSTTKGRAQHRSINRKSRLKSRTA